MSRRIRYGAGLVGCLLVYIRYERLYLAFKFECTSLLSIGYLIRFMLILADQSPMVKFICGIKMVAFWCNRFIQPRGQL